MHLQFAWCRAQICRKKIKLGNRKRRKQKSFSFLFSLFLSPSTRTSASTFHFICVRTECNVKTEEEKDREARAAASFPPSIVCIWNTNICCFCRSCIYKYQTWLLLAHCVLKLNSFLSLSHTHTYTPTRTLTLVQSGKLTKPYTIFDTFTVFSLSLLCHNVVFTYSA